MKFVSESLKKDLSEEFDKSKVPLTIISWVISCLAVLGGYYARLMYVQNHSTFMDVGYSIALLIVALSFNFISYAISADLAFACFAIGRKKQGYIRLMGPTTTLLFLIFNTITMFNLYILAIIGAALIINSNKSSNR